MNKLGIEDIELVEIGNSISFAGTLWFDAVNVKYYILPCEQDFEDIDHIACFDFSDVESYRLLNQAWLLESTRYTDLKRKTVRTALARSRSDVDPVVRWKVFRRDGFVCQYCGLDQGPMTYDHFVPVCKGGSTTLENGRTACRKCNKSKGDIDGEEWLVSERLKDIRKSREKKK